MTDYLVYASTGRLLIWLFQTNGITKDVVGRYTKDGDLVREFVECDLCVGFWVFLILAILAKSSLSVGLWPRPVEKVIIAGLTTLLVHLVRIGWDSKFAIIEYN